jgi:hypothetical protein
MSTKSIKKLTSEVGSIKKIARELEEKNLRSIMSLYERLISFEIREDMLKEYVSKYNKLKERLEDLLKT